MTAETLPTQEDRLVAALSHASIALYLVGPVVPLIAWVAQRERSAYLRFQAAQALAFQLIASVFYLGLTICGTLFYMASLFPALVFSEGGEPSGAGLAAMIVGIVTMCVAMGTAFIAWPLLICLGFWAALQALRGRTYRYPLVGGWVERFFERNERNAVQSAEEVRA